MTRQIFAALALLLVTAQASFAAEYDVSVAGQLDRDGFSSQVFGITADSTPVSFSLRVDEALVTQVPAFGNFNDSGIVFDQTAQLIPRTAISNFSLTIGTGSWTEADFVAASTNTSIQYDVIVTGSLAAPTGIYFLLSSAAGDLQLGTIECAATCVIANTGVASAPDGLGYFSNLSVSSAPVVVVPPVLTAAQKAAALVAQISAMPIKNGLVKLTLLVEAKAIQKLIAEGKLAKAKCSVDIFKASVKLALRLKALTAAQSAALLASADDLRSSL